VIQNEDEWRKRRVHNAVSRTAAFSIVVLMHVAVLTASWQRLAPERKDQRSLTWVHIEPRADAPPTKSTRNTPAPEQDFAVRPPLGPAVEPASPAISAPPIDWRANMEAAASSAADEIIRQQGYRPLGPIAHGESGPSPSESIFERPHHEAGDIDHDPVQGRTVVWHSEHCYTELKFPTIKDPNALVGVPNSPKCMFAIGRRRPRADLFDAIK
jgi:hypothetical protein